uniref:[methylamine--corrinoid protein] Co-methyltransferase n=1 Tax=Candidatus Methanomethylicus mesodigestus TaxID=1867258 RepID=A0A7C3J4S5_9CREN
MTVEIIEVLDRAENGPIMPVKEWDAKFLPRLIAQKLKEYDIAKSYDPNNPVNTDDSLADAFWKAGFELFVESGAYCLNTSRRILFSEREVRQILQDAPTLWVTGGPNEDRVEFRKRVPEDNIRPVSVVGAMGIHVDEEIYVKVLQSIAQWHDVDCLLASTLPTVRGRKIKARTPLETYVGKYEGMLYRQAVASVGRPWLPVWCAESAASEYGNLGGYGAPGAYRQQDLAIILAPTELKTGYDMLHKVAHDVYAMEGVAVGNHFSMIGGYCGGPEGAALAAVAAAIMQRAVHFLTITGGLILNMWTMGNCDRQSVWADSVTHQAQSRNSHMLILGLLSTLYGCVTPELLYEIAVLGGTHVVSGCSMVSGTRPTGCRYPNHTSGLENKFAGEITHCMPGVKRDAMNEIAKKLLPKYENNLMHPNKGKSWYENTDPKTLMPTKEWWDIYLQVKKELTDLGVPFERL